MDYNYRITAKNIGFKIDKVAGDDLTHFPSRKTQDAVLLFFRSFCIAHASWVMDGHLIGELLVLNLLPTEFQPSFQR